MIGKFLRKAYKSVPPYSEESSKEDIKQKEQDIGKKLQKNTQTFQSIYSYPDNQDVKIRELHIGGLNKKATVIFISTITDTNIIEQHIIRPLIENSAESKSIKDIVSVQTVATESQIKKILSKINSGNAALLIDGEEQAQIFNVSSFEGRGVEKSQNESLVKGPKEAFNEMVFTNISLIRKKIKNENLVVESTTASVRSKNEVYMVYVKDLANDKLVDNVRNRIKSLNTDVLQNLGLLEQRIEERPRSVFPTILYTERPDRAASFAEDGYIVLLMDNSPDALILPATFWSFYHSSEDHYLRFLYGNFTRMLRIAAMFITLFSSAIYISIVTFHAEMIPPDLLLAIAASREKVPFPAAIEIIIMEIAFELIREAGLRVPSPIGPTIGIVGALILGQAAVQANIVSPIVVIVVALGGLSSFAIADISMNFAIRLCRFLLVLSAAFFGIYGMAALFTIGLFYLVSIKSFGVPYLSPLSPKYISSGDTVFRRLLRNEFYRPGYLKPKDMKKQ
ncbi:spore germination protein [Oceanobacillus halotolerans]|uniref:spore germination protein n=1 Tax=Oceanobacillus halotolerans TaxID=2663380 RepID=UPI0013DBEE6B|nr:spore germination protein [Oceanobacillus halotolerans]